MIPELEFASMGELGRIPSKYRGNLTRFLVDSVYGALMEREPDVVVIDNLAFLLSSRPQAVAGELRALMKTLRRWVNDCGTSVMLIAHSVAWRGRQHHSPGHVEWQPGLEMADRIIALMPSTIGAGYRYLKTVFPAGESPGDVEGLRIERGVESMGMMPEETHLFDYRSHAEMVRSAVGRAEERFGERRKFRRAAVPSRLRIRGIEDAA